MESSLECDVLVVGGGINGTAIARDAAGRGLSVVLCEQDDLASHTSSASTKLIHGGLRYLEYFEISLVRKALREREVLLRTAPHLIHPLCFVLPHDSHLRPSWIIRAGLFLYDHLARRELLPASEQVSLHVHPAGQPLKPVFVEGFTYADGWVDDARLVVTNAVDAAERGATILPHTRCASATRRDNAWHAELIPTTGRTINVRARCLVNAAGPWAEHFAREALPGRVVQKLHLVKGSHIVVPRLFDHSFAYIFQHPDRRIVFAIPYESDFTLIGTTDLEFAGDPAKVAIDQGEIDYLCELCNRYFSHPVCPADVVWAYSGVRPLLEDSGPAASALTRDYRLELNNEGAPLLSIFGGKITTSRKLAEDVVDRLSRSLLTDGKAWTATSCLPGGDIEGNGPSGITVHSFDDFVQEQQRRFQWLPESLVTRYARAYGTRIEQLLSGCKALSDLGPEILPGLYETEAIYWMEREWALTAEDMLWRRSKLGLHISADEARKLAAWLMQRGSCHATRLA